MMRQRGWRSLWIVCAAALALGCDSGARDAAEGAVADSAATTSAGAASAAIAAQQPTPQAPDVAASGFGPTVGFRTATRLDEHFAKHGAEFGTISKGEYLRQAQQLRDATVSATVLEVRRADGVVSRFDRTSGAFIAFDRDGIIRTFFRPNDGEAYFRRQARRRPNP